MEKEDYELIAKVLNQAYEENGDKDTIDSIRFDLEVLLNHEKDNFDREEFHEASIPESFQEPEA